MPLKKSIEEIKDLQSNFTVINLASSLEDGIEELKEIQEQLQTFGKDPKEEMGASIDELNSIQDGFQAFGKNESLSKAQLILQVLGFYGVAKLTEFLDRGAKEKFKTSHSTALRSLVSSIIAHEITQRRPAPIEIDSRGEEFSRFDVNGLNSLNRWNVRFLGNETIDIGERIFLSKSCKEVSVEAYTLQNKKIDIVTEKNEDIADVQIPQSATFTFLVDRDLNVKRIIEKLIAKIRNPYTGRYGYKDDYKFEEIRINIFDSMNRAVRIYTLYDAVVSGQSELSLAYGASEFQTTQMSFVFSRFDMKTETL